MKRLLYCVYGYENYGDAKQKVHGHLYWFNPRMICSVVSYAVEEIAFIKMADEENFWCDLGEWETIINEIHTYYCSPKDVRIQEVVVKT